MSASKLSVGAALRAMLVCTLLWVPATSIHAAPEPLVQKPISELSKEELTRRMISLSEQLRKSQDETSKKFREVDLRYYDEYHQFLKAKGNLYLSKLEWQSRASEVILWLVVFVVTSGVVFSGYQLLIGSGLLHSRKIAKEQSEDIAATSFEISPTGMRLSSSVIGLIILGMSIIFLYLFLQEVYRLRVVDESFRAVKSELGDVLPVSKPAR